MSDRDTMTGVTDTDPPDSVPPDSVPPGSDSADSVSPDSDSTGFDPTGFDPADCESRSATVLILSALGGSVLLPFFQAVATKAGEDVYQAIRGKLSRPARRRAEAEIREAGVVTLAGRDARVVLQLPERITPAMAARLEGVRLPVDRADWSLVSWDQAQGRWVVETVAEPPAATTTVSDEPGPR
jgi:hypothetical protein